MVDDDEFVYYNLPSIDIVEAHIDSVLVSSIKSDVSPLAKVSFISSVQVEQQHFYAVLQQDIVRRKIGMAIGSVTADIGPCPLFTSTLDELEDRFQSQASALASNRSKEVSSEFLKNI